MLILGISAYYHDSAAAIVRDGEILAAASEERFTRIKHDAAFPAQAIQFCLDFVGVELADIDRVVYFEKPFLKFERLLETYTQTAPRGFGSFRRAMPLWIKEKLFQKPLLRKELGGLASTGVFEDEIWFSEHHLSHAASAFYPSPFQDALVLTMDGVGEWATTTAAIGAGTQLEIIQEIHFPHSLGLLYSAFTYYTGFRVNSGEYKVMGLAPYGEPGYADLIRSHLIDIKSDGSFRLDQQYFDYCAGLTMTNQRFHKLFGGPARLPESPLEKRHLDLAASVQVVVEEIVLKLASGLARQTGQKNLCLAGGVALNCVANGKLQRSGLFENIWIQPASGDAGGALGAALYVAHGAENCPRISSGTDGMRGAYLGPEFDDADIQVALTQAGAEFAQLARGDLIEETAAALAAGEAIGWFQGRMEFGPRALGGRSILADPRGVEVQKDLNLKVKFRESFRPFAPSVLIEAAGDWFGLKVSSPYMLLVDDVLAEHRLAETGQSTAAGLQSQANAPRSTIPAVTHVDYSARIQTVHRDTNLMYHELIEAFRQRTGCPMLVNTSFNVRGEPIVCTPQDAFRCFMSTGLDRLVIGSFMVLKQQQNPQLAEDYRSRFNPD